VRAILSVFASCLLFVFVASATSVASLDYYPDDKTYPFKRLNAPQKLWLAPKPE
jgi:hypothetical protein